MECKNCNEKLTGKERFCSNCGQKNIANLNLKYLFDDFLDNYLSMDSKLFKTIYRLLLFPGFLSTEFLLGRRASYVPPVKFYIALSVLFFFLISIKDIIPSPDSKEKSEIITGFSYQDKKIELSKEKYLELDRTNGFDAYIRDSMQVDNAFARFMIKKTMVAKYNGDSFSQTLINQISLFLLLFIPFISLVYKWTFSRNKYNYIKHVVFNIHFNSFVILLLIINQLIKLFMVNNIGVLLVLVGAIAYLFTSIKRFYQRKWWCVLYKMFFLLCGYISLVIIFTLLIIFVSLIFTN